MDFGKLAVETVEETKRVLKDGKVCDLVNDFMEGNITISEYAYKMMKLALERGEQIAVREEADRLALEAHVRGLTHADVKAASVIHSDRRKVTDINGTQFVSDANMDNAMAIPALEAIFANANPEDYLNQVLAVAVHQAWVLQKIEASLKLQ